MSFIKMEYLKQIEDSINSYLLKIKGDKDKEIYQSFSKSSNKIYITLCEFLKKLSKKSLSKLGWLTLNISHSCQTCLNPYSMESNMSRVGRFKVIFSFSITNEIYYDLTASNVITIARSETNEEEVSTLIDISDIHWCRSIENGTLNSMKYRYDGYRNMKMDDFLSMSAW